MFPVDSQYKKKKKKSLKNFFFLVLMSERKYCRSETCIYIKRGKW